MLETKSDQQLCQCETAKELRAQLATVTAENANELASLRHRVKMYSRMIDDLKAALAAAKGE